MVKSITFLYGGFVQMRRDVWIFLFVLGIFFFSWPIMTIFRENLVLALFIIWFLFIVLMMVAGILSEREDGR